MLVRLKWSCQPVAVLKDTLYGAKAKRQMLTGMRSFELRNYWPELALANATAPRWIVVRGLLPCWNVSIKELHLLPNDWAAGWGVGHWLWDNTGPGRARDTAVFEATWGGWIAAVQKDTVRRECCTPCCAATSTPLARAWPFILRRIDHQTCCHSTSMYTVTSNRLIRIAPQGQNMDSATARVWSVWPCLITTLLALIQCTKNGILIQRNLWLIRFEEQLCRIYFSCSLRLRRIVQNNTKWFVFKI